MSSGGSLTHRWDLAPAEARALQGRLRDRLIVGDRFGPIRRVAGADVHFPRGRHRARAAVAVFRFPELESIEEVAVDREVDFPYVPGLLSFREIPPVLEALAELSEPPDLLLCDGHGYAHPRRFGLACHLGVAADLPTIGVAKSRLVGGHEDVPPEKGARRPLLEGREVIGTVLRTRTGVRPLYISIGHRVSLETAADIVLRCTTRYRLPEPSRAAHALAGRG